MHPNQLTLVTGPSRSGKSEWAETLAVRSGKAVIYVATAQMSQTDPEWQARIERHQQRRPPEWQTLHVPVELVATIQRAPANHCLLIDSLGTWLANLLDQQDTLWEATVQDLLRTLRQSSSRIILVAEEVGWGLVPPYPSGRTFRDRLGDLTRQIGAIAHPVYLVTAGYVLNLSTLGVPLDGMGNGGGNRDGLKVSKIKTDCR
ncbi:bifunctional adenosylcobinamide kinase/adenosylcobinamide-phosphate guanylyltransferase [Kovacikia minuta CCNUW1]|uniref:bifunctional adenosylcobinamide kinase/adenosylcobinamide-phosphate guanylyltransferase n=1 Tax=Kovacikia minuta TaxID=2931930 RepID=UPI001CCE526E|nr:bifunctional adenosylcobinamide kinase/adenosylcobinamide-phosphate guanylyltransferase [Kovacikia minuta]UBF28409.1 bifunctional adenosylcobinamide kinase/adenosylcobinamide-phosphate guanylyltransferase [Kovacikia minuta CCNUW1]